MWWTAWLSFCGLMLDLFVKLSNLSNATLPLVGPNGTIQISAIPFHAKIHVVVQVAVFQSMGRVCQFPCASCTEYLHMHAFTSCSWTKCRETICTLHAYMIYIFYMYTYSTGTCSYPLQSKVLSNGHERNSGTGEGWAANNWCVGSSASALCRVFVQKNTGWQQKMEPLDLHVFLYV